MSSPTLAVLERLAARIQPLRRIRGMRHHVHWVAFSPDSRTMAIAGAGVWLIDVASDKILERDNAFSSSGDINSTSFSQNGEYFAAGGMHTLKVWEMKTQRELGFQGDRFFTLNSLAFSPDGKLLAVGLGTGLSVFTVEWDLTPFEGHFEPFKRPVNSITFSRDGALLACGADDTGVRVYDVRSGSLLWRREHSQSVGTVAFSPDGRFLASGSGDNTIRLWGARDGKVEDILQAPGRTVKSVVWHPGGSLLVSRSRDSGEGVRIWHRQSGRVIHAIPQLKDQNDDVWSPRALAISPDGRFLATYPPETINEIQVWDISSLSEEVEATQQSRPRRVKSFDIKQTAIDVQLRTLPLSHVTPPTPSQPASWLRGTTVIGVRPPLFVVQDLGTLVTQSKPQLERPKFLPPDINTSGYLQFLMRLSSQPLLRQVSGWDLSDSMVGVILARLLDGINFSEDYSSFNAADVVPFARLLAVELDRASPEQIWRDTEPATRPSLSTLLPAEAQAKIETNLRRLDADELRFLHQYGPRFAGAPDPRDLLDLFSLLDLPPAVQLSLTQMLRLIPRVSQCKSSGGAQTYAMGGYAGLTNKGNLDSLIPTELAYPEDVLLYRLLNQDALYYGRETEREKSRELIYIITHTGLDLLGDGDVLARALTLAIAQTMQRRGYEVQQSFVGSTWTEPSTMLRPQDVQRVLYHRDKGSLRAKAMLEAVLLQLRVWSERYRSMQVMWVVSEHWDTDDLDANRDLYNAIRQQAEQQAWFVRVGNNTANQLQQYPPAARQFKQHQIVSSDVMWADLKPPERIFVEPQVEQQAPKPSAQLRFDGVYAANVSGNRWNVLRFYDDGTVVSGFFAGKVTLTTVFVWFRKDFPSALTGKYSIGSSGIFMRVDSANKVATYNGEILKDRLRLIVSEFDSGERAEKKVVDQYRCEYEFEPMPRALVKDEKVVSP